MKKNNLNKSEIFKDFKDVQERINYDCIYAIQLNGEFSEVDDCDFNIDFEKELYKILPKNILTMGYRCRGCGTWICNTKSLCNMCLENYNSDMNDLGKKPRNSSAKSWVEYHSDRHEKQLFLAFTTSSPIDVNLVKDSFKPMEYIKEISMWKTVPDDDNIQCQRNVSIYNNMYILQDM